MIFHNPSSQPATLTGERAGGGERVEKMTARREGQKMATKKIAKKAASRTKKPSPKSASYVILRGYRSGVHAGELVERNHDGHFVLRNARRIWQWKGAQTLSEVAVYGLSSDSKVAPVVERQEIAREDVSEIIHCCEAGRAAIVGAREWRA